MPAAADRLEFTPPPQPGAVRAFALAVLAHVLLMLALTWGISWNRESENAVAEAELWSSVPRQAAPAAATAPPVVQAPPMPTVPPPPPAPAPKVEPTPPAPLPKPPDIALEQEKRKQEEALRRQAELERQKKIEARQRQDELDRQKKLEARKKEDDLKKRQLAEQKAAEEKKRQEEQVQAAKAKARQQEEAKRLEAQRQDNLRRMQGLAGATGAPSSTGTALRASGPSQGYASRIAARIKPNIVFNDIVSGNPSAEVEIRVAPDGTIVGRKLTKSSGVKSWDEAVLRAIDKTEVLPRDTDGTVVPKFPINFRPHD